MILMSTRKKTVTAGMEFFICYPLGQGSAEIIAFFSNTCKTKPVVFLAESWLGYMRDANE